MDLLASYSAWGPSYARILHLELTHLNLQSRFNQASVYFSEGVPPSTFVSGYGIWRVGIWSARIRTHNSASVLFLPPPEFCATIKLNDS
jgi:hypothetical protein